MTAPACVRALRLGVEGTQASVRVWPEQPRSYPAGPFELLSRFLELLEPGGQPVTIRAIRTSPWQLDHLPDDPLEAEFRNGPSWISSSRLGDVNSVIGVDADQVGIEGGAVDLR